MSYGEICMEGDRVRVLVNRGGGDFKDYGAGEVVKVFEGINRVIEVRHDNGEVARYGWKHICRDTVTVAPRP